jgi:hypothetical protein
MKLWILKPTHKGYSKIDQSSAMIVVSAANEHDARNLAQRSWPLSPSNIRIWSNEEFSTCTELRATNEAAVVFSTFRNQVTARR